MKQGPLFPREILGMTWNPRLKINYGLAIQYLGVMTWMSSYNPHNIEYDYLSMLEF